MLTVNYKFLINYLCFVISMDHFCTFISKFVMTHEMKYRLDHFLLASLSLEFQYSAMWLRLAFFLLAKLM